VETSPSDTRVVHRYVALGDSFTAGAPGSAFEGRWPDYLAETLRAVNPELEYHNLGQAGVTTAEVAGAQLAPCLALDPDLVTVVCGANDVLLNVRPDIRAHATSLNYIFTKLHERLPGVALMTATTPQLANHLDLRPRSRKRVEEGVIRLNEATRDVAERHGVVCLEFADHPDSRKRDYFGADGFHPSAEGIRRAAGAGVAALRTHFGIRITQEEMA
jgi:lysophospholipase L1-like esterase